jgi:hypothetical protein
MLYNLHRLIYVSDINRILTQQEIDDILEKSKKNNKLGHVTGVLIHDDSHFLQYLEGDRGKLQELYLKIKTDRRHQNCSILNFEKIGKRTFHQWEMAYKSISIDKLLYYGHVDSNFKKDWNDFLNMKRPFDDHALDMMKSFFYNDYRMPA